MNYLPDKLVNLRKHYNYSQKYIAKVLDVDIVDYMGFENGRSVLNHNQIIKLSKFYHIDYVELFKNDDKVTLYEVDKQDTDKVNIEFFIPKNTIFNRLKKFIKNNKLYVGIGIGAITVVLVVIAVNLLLRKPVQNEIYDINTLSVSNRTVLYLNSNGAAKGSGDNSYSQLSNLPTENVVKVLANDEYSVFLLNDGTLFVCGDVQDSIKEELLKKRDIVDIAIGSNHILILNNDGSVTCIGNNDNKQCDIDNTQKVSKIFAGKNASVVVKEDGQILYSGDFIGKSSINDEVNIQDVDFGESSIIFLKEDGTVDYNSNTNNKYYIETLKWENIKDVACGNDFFIGLKEDGTLVVASENEHLKEAENLTGIIAIDAADKYFIAYDGKSIYGFGENRFNQFISSPDATTKLSSVDNIEVTCSKDTLSLSFNSVDNATGYEITMNDFNNTYSNNINISLDTTNLNKGDKYIISIKAIGDDYYEDSDLIEYEFEYNYDEEIVKEEKKEQSITITQDLLSLSKEQFDTFLNTLNVASVEAIESDEICPSDKITISDIEGIVAGATYKKSELEKLLVKYRYCKIEQGDSGEEDLDS